MNIFRQILLPLIFIAFNIPVSGQTNTFECKPSLLNEGVEFEIDDPKELEGTYKFTIVPEWDTKAEMSVVELVLKWEERYVELQGNSFITPYVNYPLIGFMRGDIQKSTVTNINDKLSVSDPFNPAFRFISETNTLRLPGGKVNPECEDCFYFNVDGIVLEFRIKRIVGNILLGEWVEDLGILSTQNSEGKWVNKATGYFCAEKS